MLNTCIGTSHITCCLLPIVDEGIDNASLEEYEFPPPPPELLGGSNHSKQLSEASLLSEASTVKHRKTPSVESLDALPNAYPANYEVIDNLTASGECFIGFIWWLFTYYTLCGIFNPKILRLFLRFASLCLTVISNLWLLFLDSKLNNLMKAADEYLEKSMEQEKQQDMNSALVFCRQSVSK